MQHFKLSSLGIKNRSCFCEYLTSNLYEPYANTIQKYLLLSCMSFRFLSLTIKVR